MIVQELFARLGFKVDPTSFHRADSAIGGLKRTLITMGATLAAGAIVRGIQNVVEETGAAAVEAGRAAQRIGMTVEAFEEFKHAAAETGVTVEQFETGMGMLARQMSEAKQGTAMAVEAFQALGVRVTNGKGALKDTDEILLEIADKFAAMPDGAKKTALAMDIFSRSGRLMIPMLNTGRAGMEAFRAEARELGIVFSKDDVEAAEKLRMANSLLGDTLEGLRRRIGLSLLPVVTQIKNDMAQWVKANRELLAQKIVSFAYGLTTAFRMFVRMTEPIRDLVSLIADIASKSEAMRVALLGVGAVLLAAFNAPLSAFMLLLAVIEEFWGWIKGTRKTVLEDMFGPFDEFTKKNAFGQMIQSWIDAFNHLEEVIKEVIRTLDVFGWFGTRNASKVNEAQYRRAKNQEEYGQNLREAMRRVRGGTRALPYTQESELDKQLGSDPNFNALVRAGAFDTIERLYGPYGGKVAKEVAVPSLGDLMQYRAPAGPPPPVNVTIGDITVGKDLPEGLSPEDFVRQLGEEIVTQSDLQSMLSGANAAVTR